MDTEKAMNWPGTGIRWAVVTFIVATFGTAACTGSSELESPPPTSPTTPTPDPPPATKYTIELSPASITLVAPPGEPRSVVVTATVRTESGGVVPEAAVVWTTDSQGVATVTATGTVTAVAVGHALLRASFGGSQAAAQINVLTVSVPVTFTPTGSMETARIFHTATLLPDGKVLVAGGYDASGVGLATAELYDPASGTFARTGGMTRPRIGHSATLLPNGKVLIAGGYAGKEIIGTAELYDPATGTFSLTGEMRRAQQWHVATLLKSGKVLVTAGFGLSSVCCSVTVNPELYDPATGVFETTGTYDGVEPEQYVTGLLGSVATLLRDGRVLLTAEPVAQIYDPVAGTFSRTGAMMTAWMPSYINGRTATLLDNDRVLLTGGHNEDIGRFKSAELYDPATGRFTATGDMSFVRDGHTATLLSNGTVLITGGESESGCAIVSLDHAELYDPSKGSFRSAGRMNVRREWHTATRLVDGRVLVTGGMTFDGGLCGGVSVRSLASAEIYVPGN